MKTKLFIGLAVSIAIIATGSFVLYRSYVTSPEYSLKKIAEAVSEKNADKFEKYVDTDKVVAMLVDDFFAYIMDKEKKGELDTTKQLGLELADGMIKLARPQLIEDAKKSIASEIRSGKSDDGNAGIIGAMLLEKIVRISKDSDFARFRLTVTPPKYNKDIDIEIKLVRISDYWKVTEVTNSRDIFAKFDAFEKERVELANQATQEKIKQAIQFVSFGKESQQAGIYGFLKRVKLTIAAEVPNPAGVKSYQLSLYVYDNDDNLVKEFKITSPSNTRRDKAVIDEYFVEINQANASDMRFYNTPDDACSFKCVVNKLELGDGSVLVLEEYRGLGDTL